MPGASGPAPGWFSPASSFRVVEHHVLHGAERDRPRSGIAVADAAGDRATSAPHVDGIARKAIDVGAITPLTFSRTDYSRPSRQALHGRRSARLSDHAVARLQARDAAPIAAISRRPPRRRPPAAACAWRRPCRASPHVEVIEPDRLGCAVCTSPGPAPPGGHVRVFRPCGRQRGSARALGVPCSTLMPASDGCRSPRSAAVDRQVGAGDVGRMPATFRKSTMGRRISSAWRALGRNLAFHLLAGISRIWRSCRCR